MQNVEYVIACELPNFQRLHNERIPYIRNDEVTFLKRGHFIFGYKKQSSTQSEYIHLLCEMFGLYSVFVLYDTKERKWEESSEEALQEMGVNRNYLLVKARDDLFDDHELAHNEPVLDRQAHFSATKVANAGTNQLERNEARSIWTFQTTAEVSIKKIREKYDYDYFQEHMRFKTYALTNPNRHKGGRRIF